MVYIKKYQSKIGEMTLTSDGEYLTSLCFKEAIKYDDYTKRSLPAELPIFNETIKWLDIYFNGENPKFIPKIKITGLTDFRKEVFSELLKIPYGEVRSYNDIALSIAKRHNIKKMSAQAVGGAARANPICIIIPCHRVVGKNGNLTGFSGGINNKINLLKHEGIDMNNYFLPNKQNVK